ncbi:MAG: late competence development ComFB family protein [Cyanobacteria bacterium P01_A01_bin.123]
MNAAQIAYAKGYRNAMEMLVAEEVKRLFPKLSPNIARHISPIEIETYALNRLPALYASSQRGWNFQQRRAQDELKQAIATAVQQAFAAVQLDPLRLSQPIPFEDKQTQQELEAAQTALKEVRHLLNAPNLTWQSLLPALKQHLSADNTSQQEQPPRSRQWRPGTYGSSAAWQRKLEPSSAADIWSNDWYSH